MGGRGGAVAGGRVKAAWLSDPTKSKPPGTPLKGSPEARKFAQTLYESGALLRVIVERLDAERDVCVTPEAIQWWAKREGWDPTQRHPGFRLRALRGAATKQQRSVGLEAELACLPRRCEVCGGRELPGQPHQHGRAG